MVLLEAMYFGAPTVASGSAGAKTLIEDGKSGYIVKDFEPSNWAEKISGLLENAQLRKNMGEAASARIKNYFMWDSIAEKMLGEINKNGNTEN